jgi:hypothetical protein
LCSRSLSTAGPGVVLASVQHRSVDKISSNSVPVQERLDLDGGCAIASDVS